jgi:RNA polymerase primary sigma factor
MKELNTKKVGFFTNNTPIINAYYNDIRHTPVLSRNEEVALFKAYRENGDLKAKNKIIESNQKFVVSVAKKFNDNTNLLDLINEGNIGLMIAIDKYDINSGFKFITYAVWYIQREIKSFLMESPLISKTNLQKTIFYVDKIKEKFRKTECREPTYGEIIHELDTCYDIQILEESDLYDLCIHSFDLPTNINDAEFDYSPVEFEFNGKYYEKNYFDRIIDEEDNKITVDECMTILLPREKKIVELYYGINSFSEYTLENIAEKYRFSGERIRQILKQAKETLQIRVEIAKISNLGKYMIYLKMFEKEILKLHLQKKYTPKYISKHSEFTPECIQEILCSAMKCILETYRNSTTTEN